MLTNRKEWAQILDKQRPVAVTAFTTVSGTFDKPGDEIPIKNSFVDNHFQRSPLMCGRTGLIAPTLAGFVAATTRTKVPF